MPGNPTRMNQTAREQVLSSDLNRIGTLAGRELMDHAKARAVRADFYFPGTNAFDDFSAGGKIVQSIPLAGATKAASLEGQAGVFDMLIGAGETELTDTPDGPDVSGYKLLRWPAQTISWPGGGAPDATNPKVCLIVATPGDVLTDVANRNILLDPVTRAISPENVSKTSNPVATLSVVVGTAAANPLAPAVPSGTQALFEVVVPPSVADSTAFYIVRRAWRQIEFPGTSQHGILKGCVPFLDSTSTPVVPLGLVHRLVLDGELLTWRNNGHLHMLSDTNNPPAAAPATNDAPTFMYLCGGRSQPWRQQTVIPITNVRVDYAPVLLLESTTFPDSLGYPTADLAHYGVTFPRAACCYIGVRFLAAGGLTNVRAFYDGDWIWCDHGNPTMSSAGRAFMEPVITGLLAAAALSLVSVPFSSTALELDITCAGAGTCTISNAGGTLVTQTVGLTSTGPVRCTPNGLLITQDVGVSSIALPRGYNMNIPRIAS